MGLVRLDRGRIAWLAGQSVVYLIMEYESGRDREGSGENDKRTLWNVECACAQRALHDGGNAHSGVL